MIIRASAKKEILKIALATIIFLILLYILFNALDISLQTMALVFFAVIVIAFLASVALWYIYQHHYIQLGEKEVIYRTGVLNIRTITISYNKIDNIRTKRSLLSRILGLVDILIDTPGEKDIEIVAKDMPYAEYQVFYTKLREKLRESSSSPPSGYP